MADQSIRVRHWTGLEYDRLIESGFFQEGDRVECSGASSWLPSRRAADTLRP